MPDVPSIAAAGVPGYERRFALGIAAPRGTPSAIVAVLHREITRALEQPDVREAFLKTGTDPVSTRPEEFAAFVRDENAKWGKVIREIGLQAN